MMMKRIPVLIFQLFILFPGIFSQPAAVSGETVQIQVDLDVSKGPLNPIWAFFGHDEPNYTYMKDGRKLLTELSKLSPVPVFMRVHNILNSGDGTPDLKWGSTNVYTEDEAGNPVYDWTLMDSIMDSYVERGMKPLAQIGFMPKALSTKQEPYKRVWSPDPEVRRQLDRDQGWAYPPEDYEKFAELVYQWVRHSIERYGRAEVESWYWEVWNEPDGSFWQGTAEEYFKLYDYCSDAVKRALPTATIGGPHTTGPAGERGAEFLRSFLKHVVSGQNYVTGSKTGVPLDFIAFHAKGRPVLVDGVVRMDMGRQLRSIDRGFEIVSSFPELKDLPIIIGESDPEGCAACSEEFNPQNAYRNGTLYSSYTAASFARKYDLVAEWGVNLEGALTWAFEFEDQPFFAGFRSLATNGINKPVLNVFRMFGMMQGERVGVRGGSPYTFKSILDSSVRGEEPDINALAARAQKSASVLVWNYHDDNIIEEASRVEIQLDGFPTGQVLMHHYRIDQHFSNAYEAWKEMGSPPQPTPRQYAELERSGQLELYTSPEWINTKDGQIGVAFELPRQGVSLLVFLWD